MSKILPLQNKRNILITSALPYVNNVPHLGNIIGCVLSADVYARYCRNMNYNVLYICGADEYGTATEMKARQENKTPREICDKYFEIHKQVYKWFNISFDYFGRTSAENPKKSKNWPQTKIAQQIFIDVLKNDNLEEINGKQLYSSDLDTFLADRYVRGICPFCNYDEADGDQCDNCGKLLSPVNLIQPYYKLNKNYKLEVKPTNHLYISLDKLQPELNKWFQSVKSNWTNNSISITNNWLNVGLKPRCITRDLKWGTPVPDSDKYNDKYKDKVFYVWFDAPIGYLSITANYTDDWELWWKNPDNVELVQFMAKDNVPFHSIVFPATLLGTGEKYTMVSKICSTEYLNYENKKFSKSKNTGVFGDSVQETGIPADIWRFYLLAIRPEAHDSYFLWDDFSDKINNILINNLGNFINRVLNLTFKKFKKIPMISENQDISEYKPLFDIIKNISEQYFENMENVKLRPSLLLILDISREGNKFINQTEPWKIKDTQKLEVIYNILCHLISYISFLLNPFLPDTSEKLDKILNYKYREKEFSLNKLNSFELKKPKVLFNKITPEKLNDMKNKFG